MHAVDITSGGGDKGTRVLATTWVCLTLGARANNRSGTCGRASSSPASPTSLAVRCWASPPPTPCRT